MTTDPKEAAISRLTEAMHQGHVKYMAGDTMPWNREYFQVFARIAIEQGVVPLIKAERHQWIYTGRGWFRTHKDQLEAEALPIPWDAVCKGEKP